MVFCVVMKSAEWMNNAVHGITFPRANCTMVSPNCCISPLVQFIKKNNPYTAGNYKDLQKPVMPRTFIGGTPTF